MVELPLTNEFPSFRFRTTLEGSIYIFKFYFNERYERWFFNIADSEDSAILSGIPVHLNTDMLRLTKDSRKPPGQLFALNIEDDEVEADRNALGKSVFVIYEDSTNL